MRAGRAAGAWGAACVAGAGLVLLASGRDWVTVTYGTRRVAVAASELAPVLGPAAWAGLAAVVAVLATAGVWRRVVGAVMALCGAGVIAGAWSGARPGAGPALAAEHVPMATGTAGVGRAVVAVGWPVTAGAGGVLLLAGGVAAMVAGGRWPGMSDRYDRRGAGAARSAGREAPTGRALWDAIDEGADPTADPPDGPPAGAEGGAKGDAGGRAKAAGEDGAEGRAEDGAPAAGRGGGDDRC